MSAAIALAVAQGVAELVKLGIVAAQSAHEAEEVLVRAMRPTPSDAEVTGYETAMGRLREPPAPRDTDPAAPPPPATRLDEDEYP